MSRRSHNPSPNRDLNTWLDSHGYRHSHARELKTPHPYAVSSKGSEKIHKWNGMCPANKHGADFEGQYCDLCLHEPGARPNQPVNHARIIHQPPTGRPVFAAHERDHHITTSGRRALDREQFGLPPGPEEKRRGIKGRLPIDTIERARNALQRASQMQKRGHITIGQLAEVQRAVHKTWPSIEVHAHATIAKGGPSDVQLGDKFRHEGGIWQVTRISGGKATMTSEVTDPRDPFNFEKFILIERVWPQSALRKMVKM